MLDTTKESTHFTRLKAGGKFAIYALGIYLGATFTVGCLGLIIGFPLLTFPLAMLISNPVVWVLMGIVVTAAYKMVVEPLFHLAKDFISKKRAPEEEESPGKQKLQRSKSLDSGLGSITGSPNNDRKRRNSCSPSIDSGVILDDQEFQKDLQTLVHQTNRENYAYWLQQHDIAHIARIKYGYSEGATDGVFFCIPGNLESLNEKLKEYKNKVEQENLKVTFTSVVNLGNLHWTTLVVAYNPGDKQFSAYYCDSFSAKLPSPGSKRSSIKLANEIKDKLFAPLTNQASKLNAQGKKEMGQDVRKTAQTCRDKKNELINVPINTDNIVSALEAVLEIENCNIRSSGARQQSDGHNCGIFALENARKITQMLSEGKPFDEVDKELSEYKFDLNEKRKEFAKALMNDEKWKKDLENGLLCDLPPRTETSQSSTSGIQHTNQIVTP